MKNSLIRFLAFVLVFTGCSSSIQGQNHIFSFDGYSVGVIVGNTLKYYYFSERNERWMEEENLTFALPNGYKTVFSFDGYSIGVIVGNTLKYYYFSERNERWMEEENLTFIIN